MQKRKKKKHHYSKKKQRMIKRNLRIALAVVVGVLVILVASITYVTKYVNRYDGEKSYANVFVGDTDVSKMSAEEVRSALEEKIDVYGKNKVVLATDTESVEVTLAELGLSIEKMDDLIENVVSYGKTGALFSRYQTIKKLEKQAYTLTETYVVNEERANEVIKDRVSELEHKAVNATISRSGGSFVITEEKAGVKVDVEKSLDELVTILNEGWDHQNITLNLVQTISKPKVTKTDLETIQDEMGSFWTQAGGGTRLQNLIRATELLNGLVVMPGEEISVESLTKPYTLDNGYVEGTAYENGQIVKSIAGGLCQVSSTLYNALLYSEVEITLRSAHSMLVSYVKPSRDAAIAEGVKDLKFRNNYDTPIFIEGFIDGNNRLYFKVFGKDTRVAGHSVEYESEVVEETEYKKKFVADSANAIGSIIEDGTGIDGKVAKLWKVVYENGKEVSRKVANNSTYKASEVTVKIGTKSEYSDASKLVKSAIESQDEDKIKNAISKAKDIIEAQERAQEVEEQEEEETQDDSIEAEETESLEEKEEE